MTEKKLTNIEWNTLSNSKPYAQINKNMKRS